MAAVAYFINSLALGGFFCTSEAGSRRVKKRWAYKKKRLTPIKKLLESVDYPKMLKHIQDFKKSVELIADQEKDALRREFDIKLVEREKAGERAIERRWISYVHRRAIFLELWHYLCLMYQPSDESPRSMPAIFPKT